MIVGRGADRIEVRHLPSEVRDSSVPNAERSRADDPGGDRAGAHRAGARRPTTEIGHTPRASLGISRATLIKKIKEYGLNPRAR